MSEETRKYKNYLLIVAGIAILLILIAATVLLWPYFQSLTTPQGQLALESWVDSLGVWGWVSMLGLQILQVIVAVVPGEPIEILMGVLYGAWGGFLTCELGVFIGSIAVFWTVRKLGAPLVERIFGKDRLQNYAFLHHAEKLELITFILFFIPGTPKDILTYFAGLTPISAIRFLSIAIFARIPSILSSTWGGSSIAQGQWIKTVAIFVVVGLISLAGLLAHNKIMTRIHTRREQTKRSK